MKEYNQIKSSLFSLKLRLYTYLYRTPKRCQETASGVVYEIAVALFSLLFHGLSICSKGNIGRQ